MKVFKKLFLSEEDTFRVRMEQIKQEYADNNVVSHMIDFATSENSRPLCQAK
jgi:acyl-[acyl carrier protein]--UDP-N-acetylglucosamine O-acyltransferase